MLWWQLLKYYCISSSLGVNFDFFGIGEFWGCKSLRNDFGLQYRFFYYERASLIGGVALKAGHSLFTVMTIKTDRPRDSPVVRYVTNITQTKKTVTVKFVVSRCACYKLQRDFGLFCSVKHFTEGGVNANHNVTCSPSLAENESRLFKNIAKEIAMVSGFLSKEGGRRCFILAMDKNKKEQKNLRSNLM